MVVFYSLLSLTGTMKYSHGDVVEFFDRLVFVTARKVPILLPSLTQEKPAKKYIDLVYQMEVPEELQPYIHHKYRQETRTKQMKKSHIKR